MSERHKTQAIIEEHFPIGGLVDFEKPVSTTEKPEKTGVFARDDVVIEILAHKAAPVGVISAWGVSEAEWLMPSDTKYRVVSHLQNARYGHEDGHSQFMTVIQVEQQ